ncbi:phage terminase large subunit family protein, partial [Candidatus Pacearchaeota archaeon]|nr:phage terminase large subunit family protein [Candidatus Pacearchaeota archaeon]
MADKENLGLLTQQDPLAYGITHIDLLQGRLWEVEPRAWIKEIYQEVNPWILENDPVDKARQMVLMKPTQVGMSTMAAVRMFHFADNWPVRVIYMLPRQQDYIDFVTTRIDPMIASSDRLKSLLGIPDSTRAKQLGDSYLFFMESTVEPRMMPADALMVDELDLSDPANVGTALNRLDDSNWQLIYYFSTPTLPNYGIHGRYLLSDMRKWLVKCPSCNEWQELDWEVNLRVIGSLENPQDVFLGCTQCNHRIDLETIQKGQWVPEKPSKSKDSIGFHISQMMVHPIETLYKHWLDPQQTIIEFYRKRLGKPYELVGGSVTREDFLIAAFDS